MKAMRPVISNGIPYLQMRSVGLHSTSGSLELVWRYHHFLSLFLANSRLPRVSRQILLSGNEKGDNKMMPGAVQKSPGIYLKSEENPGKPQLGDLR